jgi:hypothetical protein
VTPLRHHDATADFSTGGGGATPTATDYRGTPAPATRIERTGDRIILYPPATATELGSPLDGPNDPGESAERDRIVLYPPRWRDEEEIDTATVELEEPAETDVRPPSELGTPLDDPDTGTLPE